MRKLVVFAALFAALPLLTRPLAAQDQPAPAQDPKPQAPVMEKPGMAPESDTPAPKPKAKPAPKKPIDPNAGKTVEEIIARVNNEIITRSEYDRALASAAEDAKQECQGKCTPEQLNAATEDVQKHALRNLIDQSLLAQRGKDMGVSVEPDVIKKLDQIRTQNSIESMEELEKKVTAEGLNWEDFKNNIRNGILTQRVISSEVGSHITITNEDIQKYYDAHKTEFVRPEEVALRSIEINTAGKKPEELADLRKKADTTLKRIQDGDDFGEMAKRFSDGSTAKQGGYLGIYKRGELAKELEDKVFTMKAKQLTDVMETKQGYLILQVLEHYDEGQQTLSKVEDEIRDKLYGERMEPAMREYLKTLREQSYVVIKPGYQDIAGGGNSEIQEVSATPEVTKSRKGHKKYILFGKRASASSGD
jgi:peptidyl-prolyl cis-trans isomerase SurA